MSYFEIDVMDGYRMYSTVVKAKSEKDITEGRKQNVRPYQIPSYTRADSEQQKLTKLEKERKELLIRTTALNTQIFDSFQKLRELEKQEVKLIPFFIGDKYLDRRHIVLAENRETALEYAIQKYGITARGLIVKEFERNDIINY